MKVTNEILKEFGFPECGVVRHKGTWYEASEFRTTRQGDNYFLIGDVWNASNVSNNPGLILTPAPLPPKPTNEQLKEMAPEGMRVVLTGECDRESEPYIAQDGLAYCVDVPRHPAFYGLRWLCRVEDVPKVEPEHGRKLKVGEMIQEGDTFVKYDGSRVAYTIDVGAMVSNSDVNHDIRRPIAKPAKPLTLADVPMGAVVLWKKDKVGMRLNTFRNAYDEPCVTMAEEGCCVLTLWMARTKIDGWRFPHEAEWRTK